MPSETTRTRRASGSPRALLFAVLAVVVLVAAGCGGDSDTTSTGADVELAAGTAPTADGGQIDFGDLQGSPAMLWFWAPW